MSQAIKQASAEEGSEWVFHGKMLRMPAPKTANWLELYGSWSGFMAAVHQSIGRDLGHGVLRFSKSSAPGTSQAKL
jgi:hypothetical protein